MTNFEWMQSSSLKEVASFLCDKQYEAGECHTCPFSDRCFRYGLESHNGFVNFLEEEHED